MDRFIHLGVVAAAEAVEDSGWVPQTEEDRWATGVMIGSGIGGLGTIYEASVMVYTGKARRLSPFFIPSALINLVSGHVSIRYGFKGPNHSAVTACATGVHAIGDAARLIGLGDADVMVAGGAEAAVNELGIAGFCASRALSTAFNDRSAGAPLARGIGNGTDSSWARAPASWCSRSSNTPKRAEPRSTPKCAATACPATRTTSPRRPMVMTAPTAP